MTDDVKERVAHALAKEDGNSNPSEPAIRGAVVTDEMVERAATAKLNFERAAHGLNPVTLNQIEDDDADLYRMDARVVLEAALGVKETTR